MHRSKLSSVSTASMIVLAALWVPSPDSWGADDPEKDDPQTTEAKPAPGKSDDKALKEFLDIYSLVPGQVVKRIAPPRPAGIQAFWKKERPGFANREDQFGAMTFRWSDPDKLVNWAMTSSDMGFSLRDLFRYFELDIYPAEIEGDPELLNAPISGDWIYRSGVSAEQMMPALELAVQRALKLSPRRRITMRFRQVERDVVVVRGEYRYAPVAGRAKNQIEIYGQQIVPGGGGAGGGSGPFSEFLKWVGEWIERPVVSEVQTPPGSIEWFYNARSPFTKQMQREDHDETLVLKHLQEQTGLTYSRERKTIRILFVERPK